MRYEDVNALFLYTNYLYPYSFYWIFLIFIKGSIGIVYLYGISFYSFN